MLVRTRDDELRDGLGERAAAINAAQAELAEWLVEFDECAGWGGVGIRSIGHWASIALGLSVRRTNELVACGRACRQLPAVAAAFRSGELSVDKVAAIARVAVPETEAEWLHIARNASTTQLARIAAKYVTVNRNDEGDDDDPKPDPHDLRSMRATPARGDGLTAIVALLDDDEAAIVQSTIEAFMEDTWRNDEGRDQTVGARAADAIVAMAQAAMANRDRPHDSSERTTVVLHVDAEYLAGLRDHGRCHIDSTGATVGRETARRMACDAVLVALVERDGSPIDVGRARRLVNRTQRRALMARDGGCAFPGCPATRFLDAHHIDHWIDGGPTDLHNLVLLCRFHHRLHHEGGYRIQRRPDETLRFITPTGHDVAPRVTRTDADSAARHERDRERALKFTWLTPHAKDPCSGTFRDTLDGLLRDRERPPPSDAP